MGKNKYTFVVLLVRAMVNIFSFEKQTKKYSNYTSFGFFIGKVFRFNFFSLMVYDFYFSKKLQQNNIDQESFFKNVTPTHFHTKQITIFGGYLKNLILCLMTGYTLPPFLVNVFDLNRTRLQSRIFPKATQKLQFQKPSNLCIISSKYKRTTQFWFGSNTKMLPPKNTHKAIMNF